MVDSRESKKRADSIPPSARECTEKCNRRFTTYERIDEIPYMRVVKKDGRREHASIGKKILRGLLRAAAKNVRYRRVS